MKKPKKVRLLNRLWDQESGLSGMIVLLTTMQFVLIPLFGSFSFFMVILNIFWMLFLMAGIFSLATSNKQALLISIIPLLFIVFSWINVFITTPFVLVVELILSICTFSLLIILVLKKVFEPGPITAHRIIGSIVIYMLMAQLWTVVYVFFYEHISGSFQLTLPPFDSNSLQANFLYFSYVTISTTGFGEILPLHPLARALVNLEAIFGVLYPVVLIGRLVSDANVPYKKTE
jgi:Ion channel